jgi:TIR domain
MTGKNLAKTWSFYQASKRSDLCVFLSHKREDKQAAIKIGEYIMDAGIDIYLDIYDERLQLASDTSDHEAITKCLENGIENSTHILCIVSDKTKNSWWVPYEIGFAKKSNIHIASLLLKDMDLSEIPSYLYVSQIIKGTNSLNDYLQSIYESTHPLSKYSIGAPKLNKSIYGHPLSEVLRTNY